MFITPPHTSPLLPFSSLNLAQRLETWLETWEWTWNLTWDFGWWTWIHHCIGVRCASKGHKNWSRFLLLCHANQCSTDELANLHFKPKRGFGETAFDPDKWTIAASSDHIHKGCVSKFKHTSRGGSGEGVGREWRNILTRWHSCYLKDERSWRTKGFVQQMRVWSNIVWSIKAIRMVGGLRLSRCLHFPSPYLPKNLFSGVRIMENLCPFWNACF